ncbi:MAG: hypothetical protein GY822_03160 [Deltaproteobacteria bacterium]|nr:hypothetical protein [Deltaproteobacteria bacterium]
MPTNTKESTFSALTTERLWRQFAEHAEANDDVIYLRLSGDDTSPILFILPGIHEAFGAKEQESMAAVLRIKAKENGRSGSE